MTDPFSAVVALAGSASQLLSSVTLPLEERVIYYALGKEFRNGDPSLPFLIPQIFQKDGKERGKILSMDENGLPCTLADEHVSIKDLPAIPLVKKANGDWEYSNFVQGVRFVIRIIDDKDEFVKALLTPKAHVIYSGHARYGRGPCFGSGGHRPGEAWEEGSGAHPNKDGIFRMGYPYIGIPVEEIIEHGYTANLAEAVSRPKASECDPDLAPHVAALTGRTAAALHPSLLAKLRVKDPNKKWWSYRAGRRSELHVVHRAGWEKTLSDPDDIGAITPTCRVFSHMGCSTFRHNYPVVRGAKMKNWTQSGNERYAFWTDDLADWAPDHYFFQALLTYDQFNAHQPLKASLADARDKANAWLRADYRDNQRRKRKGAVLCQIK